MLTRPTAVPAHILAFGGSRLFGAPDLFNPEPEGEPKPDPYDGRSRQQFINEEKAKQLDKGVDYLAGKNAELQADLNAVRLRVPQDGQVVVSREDAAALASYREQFPTPKEAKEAKATLGTLTEKDERRSYDEVRANALAEYGDLPDAYKALIPTAEELKTRPGGAELLRNHDHLKAEVARVAGVYGAVKRDQTEQTDVGKSPAEVKGAASGGGDEAEAKSAATGYYSNRFPKQTQ